MKEFLEHLEEDLIAVDRLGRIKFISERLCRKLQYKKAEIEKEGLAKIVSSKELMGCLLEEHVGGEKNYTIEFVKRDGEVIFYDIQVFQSQMKGNEVWCILGSEVTSEVEKEEYTERILEQLPYMISVKNLDGRYMYINKKAREYVGYGKERVVGKTDSQLFGEESGVAFDQIDKQIMETTKGKYVESWLKTEEGSLKLIKIEKFPIYDEYNQVSGMVKIGERKVVSPFQEKNKENKYSEMLKIVQTGEWEDKGFDLQLTDEFEETELLTELKAMGISIWRYDKDKKQLICQFMDRVNKEILEKNIDEQQIGYCIAYEAGVVFEDGIYPIEEVDFKLINSEPIITELKRQGCRAVGIYKIVFGEELLGLFCIGYKAYDVLDAEGQNLIREICQKVAWDIKEVEFSVELKKEIQKKIEIEKELQYLLDTASDGVWINDEQFKILKVSKGICEMLKVEEEKLLGQEICKFIHPEDREKVKRIEEICGKSPGEIKRFVVRLLEGGENTLWIECGVKYLKDKLVTIGTIRNVTNRYKVYEQEKLEEQKKELEKIKKEFFSNVSKEFKVPLKRILETLTLIAQENQEGKMERYQEYIRKNIYRLLRLVSNLIDLTIIEQGRYEVELNDENIVDQIKEIVEVVSKYAALKGIEVNFYTQIPEKNMAYDTCKIERVILNLLSNAIKYTQRKGKIQVQIEMNKERVVIGVKDNGIGIPKQRLSSIFEQFVQVDESLTRHNEGSGIGLSIAKAMVELHGGTIYATSTLGEGTLVKFELPDRTGEAKKKQSERIKWQSLRKQRCLIEFADIYDLY